MKLKCFDPDAAVYAVDASLSAIETRFHMNGHMYFVRRLYHLKHSTKPRTKSKETASLPVSRTPITIYSRGGYSRLAQVGATLPVSEAGVSATRRRDLAVSAP